MFKTIEYYSGLPDLIIPWANQKVAEKFYLSPQTILYVSCYAVSELSIEKYKNTLWMPVEITSNYSKVWFEEVPHE